MVCVLVKCHGLLSHKHMRTHVYIQQGQCFHFFTLDLFFILKKVYEYRCLSRGVYIDLLSRDLVHKISREVEY